MQIVIDIPNSDIPPKQDVITLDLHFIDGHICECTYPFKELPKGHGRIGDLDRLKKEIRENDIMGGLNYEQYIDNAPTILEAEE